MAHSRRPTISNSKSVSDYKKRLAAWTTHHKNEKIKAKQPAPTAKDKDDAAKEAATASLLKNKPKGGYSKENTKDPGPGLGKDNKPRTATLEEDRKANAPKPKPKPENKAEDAKKKKLKVNFDTTPGLAKAVKKSEAETKAAKVAKEKAAKVSKRKKWAKMTKHQRKAAKRSEMFAKAKAKRNKK